MGIDSGDTLGERDLDRYMPQFVHHEAAGLYVFCGPKCGWDADPMNGDQNEYQACRDLVRRLNGMADKDEARRISRAHPWFLDPKKAWA
jgi:hypothetical protein